jgi:hypothetical protein
MSNSRWERPVVNSAPEIPESGGESSPRSTNTAGRMNESRRQEIRRGLGKAAPEEIVGEPMSEQELAEIEKQREDAITGGSPTSMAVIGYAHVPRLISEVRRLRKDSQRLNWLEKNRASVSAVTSDEFDEGTAPLLLRFYVEDGGWKRTGHIEDVCRIVCGESLSLRGAIDQARLASDSSTGRVNESE